MPIRRETEADWTRVFPLKVYFKKWYDDIFKHSADHSGSFRLLPLGDRMLSVCICYKDFGLTFFPAFLPPQQVVFCQDAPVATRLGCLEEVLRFQE